MNTSRSSAPGRRLINLWHRFNVWRAKRLYRSVLNHEAEAWMAKERADTLMRKHAEDPQKRLPLGDD